MFSSGEDSLLNQQSESPMWLATKHGFFSFSNLADGDIAIRSRVRGDLQNLQELFHTLEIHCIAGNGEYGWETILGVEEVSALFAARPAM